MSLPVELKFESLSETFNKRGECVDVRRDQFGKLWMFEGGVQKHVICGAEMTRDRKHVKGRQGRVRPARLCTRTAGWGTEHEGWGPCRLHRDMPEEAVDFWMQHIPKGKLKKSGFFAILQKAEQSQAMIDSFEPAYNMLKACVMAAAEKFEDDSSPQNLRLLASITRDFRDTTFQHQKITEQLLPKVKEYKQLAMGILMLGRRFCEKFNLGEPAYLKFTEMADETFGALFKGVGREVVAEYSEILEDEEAINER